jgi:hypothetical protein
LLSSAAFAQAAVPVDRFELTGAVVGRVCRDLDGDGRCSAGEPGIQGVRIVLETGQAALTGPAGRFHLAALDARAPERESLERDPSRPLRLVTGRHRVALDPRGLAAGESATPEATTVELPMGGAAIVNFAVRSAAAAGLQPVVPGYAAGAAPSARLERSELRYLAGGQAGPGDEVTVAGQRAEVDASGRYQAWVSLRPGPNRVPITVVSPSGAVRYLTHVLEAIKRPGGFLVVPRGLEQDASMQFPAGRGGTAAAGSTQLRVQGTPGTKVATPEREVTVGPSGEAQLPLELRPGDNDVRLTVTRPGEAPREDHLVLKATFRPLVVALVDLDGGYSLGRGALALQGRAAAHAEAELFGWNLAAELDLRDDDLDRLGTPAALLLARRPERFERSLDPELYPIAWGDLSVGVVPNQPQGRLRFEARHEQFGTLGYGPHRAVMEDAEVGRFQRALYGPYLEVSAPVGPVRIGLKAFGQSGAIDPLRPVVTEPVHEELRATSGSVFYLSAGSVVEGSDHVRVELRDGATGLPLSERHLQRGRDYELDWLSGRLLLARPLSFLEGPQALGAGALTDGVEPVLVVDWERAVIGADGRLTVGAGASASVGSWQVSGGAVRERQGSCMTCAYTLVRARGSGQVGPFTVGAEAAHSEGEAVAADAFLVSDDGGLSVQQGGGTLTRGDALSVWLRGKGLFDAGRVDAAFRWRSPGFSDRDHRDEWLFRQISLRLDQPVGNLSVGALADLRASADPRAPFGTQPIRWQVLGGTVGYRFGAFEAGLVVKDSDLTAATDPLRDPLEEGGRTSAGARLTWKATPWLSLNASHLQTLATRGSGLGAKPDTFSAIGADLALESVGTFGVKVGLGPSYGPLVWAHGEHRSGGDWYYGSYSVDVDGPSVGQGRAVAGARTDLGGGASAFVEDVATHDATAVRLARAVGVSQQVGTALNLQARYERGVRNPLGVASAVSRDAAGVSATFIQSWLHLSGRAEVRFDHAPSPQDPMASVALRQHLVSGAAEADLPLGMQLSGRVNWSDTDASGTPVAGFLEGTSALAYRADAWMAVLRGSLTQERPVGGAERLYAIASLVPALRVTDRVTVWGGLHLGWSSEGTNSATVLSASLRPAVQVVGGLELSAEVARRSSGLNDGELTALRGEAGWRFGERTYVGAGYTVLGFTGMGVTAGPENGDRLYVRAELAL